jgi:hypothetical protein
MNPPRDSAAAVLPPAEEDDPVWAAAMRAPLDDEPETEAELEAIAAGRAGSIDHAALLAELEARRPR